MSTFTQYEATCPACEHRWTAEIAQGLHITRLPEIREQILNGTFQVVRCPACTSPMVFEAAVVYTDFDRGEYIAVETAASASWQGALARHRTVFRSCFEGGPPSVQVLGRTFKRRVVRGFRALREKILLWNAGLDDRAVEAVKGDLLREHGESPQDFVLRISRVLDGGHLLFSVYAPIHRPDDVAPGATMVIELPPACEFVTAPAARYRARLAEPSAISREFPWLLDDWLVDLHDGPSHLYLR